MNIEQKNQDQGPLSSNPSLGLEIHSAIGLHYRGDVSVFYEQMHSDTEIILSGFKMYLKIGKIWQKAHNKWRANSTDVSRSM